MDEKNTKGSMEQLIQRSDNIAVIPSQSGGYDAFAAALGLFFSLKEKDKKVSLVYPGVIPQGFEDLISKAEIVADPSQRDLIVEINYSNSLAEKVNYSTQNDILTLKISPVDRNFSLNNVKSSLVGAGYDLIFLIGAQTREDPAISYSSLEEEFKTAVLVNLDNSNVNSRFGDINVVDPSTDGLSQLVLNFIARTGYFISQRPAKALLKGISYRPVN